jgi:hypothetical protein
MMHINGSEPTPNLNYVLNQNFLSQSPGISISMNILNNLKASLRELNARRKEKRSQRNEPRLWAQRGYAPPSPSFVKHQVILRNGIPDAIWVETGTYKGETAAILSDSAKKVYTIEPAQHLFAAAKELFSSTPNVEVIHGLSEEVFPQLIPKLTGEINFWLDGHFSTGVTYQGPKDTPIEDELACIEKNIGNFSRVVILIDDIRYFINPSSHDFTGYPKIDLLVDWAKRNNLEWHIEHDIFIAKTQSSLEFQGDR